MDIKELDLTEYAQRLEESIRTHAGSDGDQTIDRIRSETSRVIWRASPGGERCDSCDQMIPYGGSMHKCKERP